MRLAGLNKNDVANGEGICVSLFVQGCPHHCKGCFNEKTWNFNGGIEAPQDIDDIICDAIQDNGIQRNFSLLGGEPLAPENIKFSRHIINIVRDKFPNIKIFVWTGYVLNDLVLNEDLVNILSNIDILIDGPFKLEERDVTLKLRGSRNQRILQRGIDF